MRLSAGGRRKAAFNREPHLARNDVERGNRPRRALATGRSRLDLRFEQELLAELKPDLIITQELCEVCAVSYKTVKKAARMYVADAQVVSLEPNTIEDIFDNIETVGELCNVSEKAEEVVDESAEARLERLRARIG